MNQDQFEKKYELSLHTFETAIFDATLDYASAATFIRIRYNSMQLFFFVS